MPIKPAKETYSRNEVLEILQRNVELYKDEPGFTEYFVQLALYMMDKAANPKALIPATTPLPIQFNLRQPGGAEKASDPPVAFSRTKTPVGHQPQGDEPHPSTPVPPGRPFRPTAPPPPRNFSGDGNPLPSTPRPSHTPRPIERSSSQNPMRSMDEVALPNPASFSRDNVPKPFVPKAPANEKPHPPTPPQAVPPPGRERPVIPPPKPSTLGRVPQDGSPDPAEDSSSSIKRPRTPAVSIERQSLQTPDPVRTNLPPPPPSKDGSQTAKLQGRGGQKGPGVGKTEVYRVVRPYKSQTAMEAPCHSCGTLYPVEATYCPACGTQRRS